MPAETPNPYTQGIDEFVHVETETLFGEIPTAVPSDGTKALIHLPGGFQTQISPLGNFVRDDRKHTRSPLEHILGKRAGTWSLRKYIMPDPGGGNPDDSLIWTAGMGTNASGQIYTFKKLITQSLRLWQFVGNQTRCAIGCIVNRILVEFPDTGSPTVTFAGVCKDIIYTGSGGLLSGATATDQAVMDSGEGDRYMVGSLIRIDDTTPDSSDDYRVTAVAGDALTVTPNLTKTYAGTDTVYGQRQETQDVVGSPIPSSESSFTHQAVSEDWELISGTWEMVNNFVLRDRERGQVTPTGFSSNMERSLRCSLVLYHKNKQTALFQAALQATQKDLIVILGSQPNLKCELQGTNWVAEPINEEVGESDVIVTVAGLCIGSSSGEDEGQVDFPA